MLGLGLLPRLTNLCLSRLGLCPPIIRSVCHTTAIVSPPVSLPFPSLSASRAKSRSFSHRRGNTPSTFLELIQFSG